VSPAAELWEGLSPEERKQVARLCPERRFSRGSTIFAPGDAPDSLYVLTSGLVTLSHLSEGGQESILRVFGPGDVSLTPPGHDAWVVGNEPVVMIDVSGMVDYAKQK